MCGISGIVSKDKVDLADLKRFTRSLSHRGPDDEGYYISNYGTVAIGHKRLSIIDLTKEAGQPMFSECKNYSIVFNGEIYNYLELREELAGKGCKFYTNSDTEVILAAYKVYGPNCFERFNGMWALAIYDIVNNRMILSRDRFGVKPLYYHFKSKELFAFASETIAFKSLNGFNRQVDYQIAGRIIFQNESVEGKGYTLYKDIYLLSAGHYLVLDVNQMSLTQYRWWNIFENLTPCKLTLKEQIDEFYHLFEEACKIRLRSNAWVAVALSGGIDSSSVYCLINDKIRNWYKTSDVNFKNSPYCYVSSDDALNEYYYIRKVLEKTGKKGVIIRDVSANVTLSETILSLTKSLDFISNSPLNVLTNIYSEMKKNGIKVSVEGHGVDELMFGYHNMLVDLMKIAEKENDKYLISETLKGLSMRKMGCFKRFEKKVAGFFRNKQGLNIFQEEFNKLQLTNHQLVDRATQSYYDYEPLLPEHLKIINQYFHFTELPDNLRDFDRASMLHGVEVRMPFLDYRLVKLIFSLPFESMINKGYTKWILRQAMKNHLPKEIFERRWKVGIQSPLVKWFREDLKDLVFDTLSSKNCSANNLLDVSKLLNVLQKTSKSELQLGAWEASFIWKIVNLEIISS